MGCLSVIHEDISITKIPFIQIILIYRGWMIMGRKPTLQSANVFKRNLTWYIIISIVIIIIIISSSSSSSSLCALMVCKTSLKLDEIHNVTKMVLLSSVYQVLNMNL